MARLISGSPGAPGTGSEFSQPAAQAPAQVGAFLFSSAPLGTLAPPFQITLATFATFSGMLKVLSPLGPSHDFFDRSLAWHQLAQTPRHEVADGVVSGLIDEF